MWRNLLMPFSNVKTCHIPDLLVLRELSCISEFHDGESILL